MKIKIPLGINQEGICIFIQKLHGLEYYRLRRKLRCFSGHTQSEPMKQNYCCIVGS